jgi:Flp pilus assembly protein TadD
MVTVPKRGWYDGAGSGGGNMTARRTAVFLVVAAALLSWRPGWCDDGRKAGSGPVIGPGWEQFFVKAADPSAGGFPKGMELDGVSIDRSEVRLTYLSKTGGVAVTLVHPDGATAPLASTAKFAVVVSKGQDPAAIPAELVSALAASLKAREEAFQWAVGGSRGPKEAAAGVDPHWEPEFPAEAVPAIPGRPPSFPVAPEDAGAIDAARRQAREGRLAEAASAAKAVAAWSGRSAMALRAAASVLRSAGDGAGAARLVDAAEKVGGPDLVRSDPRLLVEGVASRLLVGDASGADRWIARATKSNAKPRPIPACVRADALLLLVSEGRLDEAKRLLRPDAGKGRPERCVAFLRLKVAWAAGDDGAVDRAAGAILAEWPGDRNAVYLWGNHYYSRGRHERAVAVWEPLVNAEPGYPGLLGQYGTAALVAHRLDRKGIDALLERLKSHPDDMVASFLAGMGLYYLHEYAQVPPLLSRVAEKHPHESRARLYLAMAHYFLGHQEVAEKMFEDLEPYAWHDPDINYCRSLIYRKRDLPRAIREMETFLKTFEGDDRLSFGPQKVDKAKSDLERMRRGEVPELNLPDQPLQPAL